MKKYLSLIPIAVLSTLTACGSSGNDAGGTATTDAQEKAAPQAGRFISEVSAMVGASSDTAEPAAVDASPATKPEDSEPSPVS